jgi:hypothetical protein
VTLDNIGRARSCRRESAGGKPARAAVTFIRNQKEMSMKKLIGVICALATVGAGTAAWAGYKASANVYVSLDFRFALGSMGTARNSADSIQYIDVSSMANSDGTSSAMIYARDASNQLAYCWSNASSIVTAARSVGTDSYILFGWDANNNCTSLEVRAASYHAPKNP